MSVLAAVCADKGSPGATTLALLLAAAHKRRPVLVEADPAGGDLGQRHFTATGQVPRPLANLVALASEARHGPRPDLVETHTTMTSWGVPLIEGLVAAEQQHGLTALWPSIAAALAISERDVVVDLGRVSSSHPGLAVAAAAQTVVVAVRPELEQLNRLRERARQLLSVVDGDPSRLLVVVISPERTGERDRRAASAALSDAYTAAVPTVWFPFVPKEVAAFYSGHLSRRGVLWRAATSIASGLGPSAETEGDRNAAVPSRSALGEAAWTTS